MDKEKLEKYLRFPLEYRIEHWAFALSFIALGLTGLIQKYSISPISETIMNLLGGVENVRVIHRIAATVMMLVVIYHVGVLGYRIYVKRARLSMMPKVEDVKNAFNEFIHNIGLREEGVKQGRYTFGEKFEYWAVVWGTIIMGVTGYMLWNPIATTSILPGEYIPVAKAAHGGEALLAVLAITIWHLYNVLVKHFNKSIYSGYISRKEMEEEHPLELADIEAGIPERDRKLAEKGMDKRKRIFWSVYGVSAVMMLVLVFIFVSYEETAITTIPPIEDVDVFVPLTATPFPTPIPTDTLAAGAMYSWDSGIGEFFTERCGQCHNSSAMLGGLDLTSFAGLMAGGRSGAPILPGDPENSLLISVQEGGGHPGQMSAAELSLIIEWIANGAPEN